MPQLTRVGTLMSAPRVAGGGGSPPSGIQPLSAYWETETNTFDTAVGGLTAAEKFAIDRFIKYCKFAGFWSRNAANPNTGIWLMCQGTEAKCLVNLLHPGTHDLTKVGNPTFTAFTSVASSSVSDYYDTGIQIKDIAQNNASLGTMCGGGTGVAGAYDMGVTSSGVTTALMSRTTADVMAGCISGTAIGTIGATTDWGVPSFKAFSRTGSSNFGAFGWGVRKVTQASVSTSTSGTETFSLLFRKGGTAPSSRPASLFFLMDGLSDQEMAYMSAACKVLVDSFTVGMPTVQPAGYGDTSVTADVVIYGTSNSAITNAYEAKRQGRSVVIVCDWLTESVEQLGGMPANGLGWVDIVSGSTTPASGIFREMIKEINTRINHTDSSNQAGMSVASQDWNRQVRKMLDATRSSGNLPGLDIPVYFSTGLRSVTKDGNNKILTMTTNDGRVFTGIVFADESYDGDLLYLSGVPVTIGREADRSGVEVNLGYHIAQRGKPADSATSNKYNVDPYVTPATPASGLLPDIIPTPTYTEGQAVPSLQGMNFRLGATNTAKRRAPFTGGYIQAEPPNYNAARYELLGRYLAASTAAGHTTTRDDLMTFTRTVATNAFGAASSIDLNNAAGVSTDIGQSGDRYLAAGFDLTARLAVIRDVIDYTRGYIWWIINSGDSRIPAALVTDFATTYGLDGIAFLDLVSWKPLYWPGLPYRREPIYQLNNDASLGFRLTGNDVAATDGTTPRSTKTVSAIHYTAFDYHMAKWIAYDASDGAGTVLWRQGGFSDSSAGGANQVAPWPMECNMPVKADCPNLLTSTCPSMTKYAFSAARMEPSMSLAGQANGIIAALAVEGSIAVQDVNYTTVRTRMLATPESVAPDIPQVN